MKEVRFIRHRLGTVALTQRQRFSFQVRGVKAFLPCSLTSLVEDWEVKLD